MRQKTSLIFCLIMDVMGCLTYILPGLGEWFDILWAPLSAFIFYRMFKGKTGKIGSIIEFLEEILPFTDFIPTFTIAHFYNIYKNKH